MWGLGLGVSGLIRVQGKGLGTWVLEPVGVSVYGFGIRIWG